MKLESLERNHFTKRGDTGRKAGKVQSKLRKKADKLKKWGEVTQNDSSYFVALIFKERSPWQKGHINGRFTYDQPSEMKDLTFIMLHMTVQRVMSYLE